MLKHTRFKTIHHLSKLVKKERKSTSCIEDIRRTMRRVFRNNLANSLDKLLLMVHVLKIWHMPFIVVQTYEYKVSTNMQFTSNFRILQTVSSEKLSTTLLSYYYFI